MNTLSLEMSDSQRLLRLAEAFEFRSYQAASGGEVHDARVIAEHLRAIAARLRSARRMRAKVAKARNLLLVHEHTSPRPGYPMEALQLLSEALGE